MLVEMEMFEGGATEEGGGPTGPMPTATWPELLWTANAAKPTRLVRVRNDLSVFMVFICVKQRPFNVPLANRASYQGKFLRLGPGNVK